MGGESLGGEGGEGGESLVMGLGKLGRVRGKEAGKVGRV